MIHLLLLLNRQLLYWLPSVQPGQPPCQGCRTAADLARKIECGEWTLPEAWRRQMAGRLRLPDPLELGARAFDRLVILYTRQPPGGEPARLISADEARLLELEPALAEVLRLLAAGLTNAQIATELHHSPRWVGYRIAELKKSLGAASRMSLLGR